MYSLNTIKKYKTSILIAVLLQTCLVFLLYMKSFLLLVIALGLFILILGIKKIEYLLYTIIIVLLIIPSEGYALPPFTFFVPLNYLYILLGILLFAYLLNFAMSQKYLPYAKLNIYMVYFLLWIIVCACIGFYNGNNTTYIRNDFLILSLYGIYFIIPSIINTRSSFSKVLIIIIVCSTIIALEYYAIFLMHFLHAQYTRINPNQALVYLFSLPLIMGIIIKMQLNNLKKILMILVLVICIGAIGITLTRGLWLAIIISLIITFMLFWKDLNKKYVLYALITISSGLALILLYLTFTTGLNIFTLVSIRANSLLNIGSDITVNQRLLTNQILWEQIRQSPILGHGLGKQFSYSYLGSSFSLRWADNSYIMLLWNVGVVGTVIYLCIVLISLYNAIKIFRRTDNTLIKIFTGATIAFIISWMILAFVSPLMIKYMLNIIWAFLFAMLNSVMVIRYENNNNHPRFFK